MIVRITRVVHGDETVLHVDGGLTTTFVGEMMKECSSIDAEFALDLANLRCVDDAGADALAKLASEGVELRGISPYIALRLQHHASAPPSASISVA